MILVTGGTGFVGRHLVRHLIAEGQAVRVLARSRGNEALPRSAACVAGDLTDPQALGAALAGVDTVVHAAAALGDAPGAVLERVNVQGTVALARAARASGVRQFIHVSSAGVYGDGATRMPHRESDVPAPSTPYERSKLAAERALMEALEGSGTGCTILRPTGLYGADRPATAALFREVARRRLWFHGPRRVVVHPAHVCDLVAAIALVLARAEARGEVLNIGGERALEYSQLIGLIGARVGRIPLQVRAPAWAWVNRAVDTDKARRLLGFEPVPLAAGLDRTQAELAASGSRPTGS